MKDYGCKFCGEWFETEAEAETHVDTCSHYLTLAAEIVGKFWQQVCARAERDGCYNAITGGIVQNYHKAATEIIAEMRRAEPDGGIPDPFDSEESRAWTCSDEACGQHPDFSDSRWRWSGERWQHHHGYPIGHVDAVRRPE